MSFKIVQTREPGRKAPCLSIVPSAWEKDGILFWPPAKKSRGLINKLIKDGTSRPESDWVPQPCVKKRQAFYSFQGADFELSAMQEKSDSECSQSGQQTDGLRKRLSFKKRTEIGRIPEEDFNTLAEECKKARSVLFAEEKGSLIGETITTVNESSPFRSSRPSSSSILDETIMQGSEEQDIENLTIPEDNLSILRNQNDLILENQSKIMQQLAKQQTTLDLLFGQMSKPLTTVSTISNAHLARAEPEENPLNDPFPIASMEALEKLEMDLTNEEYMSQLVTYKSKICGRNGKLNGVNCSYLLIDKIFVRKFLLQFSWSGGSRNEENKVAFKRFKNTMNLFFKIIRKADVEFTELQCENFFKGIVKNAKRRSELENSCEKKMRASGFKSRPKNLVYKKNNNKGVSEEQVEFEEENKEMQVKEHHELDDEPHVIVQNIEENICEDFDVDL